MWNKFQWPKGNHLIIKDKLALAIYKKYQHFELNQFNNFILKQ